MGDNDSIRKQQRAEAVADVKLAMAEQMETMVEANQIAAFRVEAPAISQELAVFQPGDIAPAMPGRDFKQQRIAFTEKVMADILNNIVNYGGIRDACVSHGVSYKQFKDLCGEYPDLKLLREEAKELYREKVSRAIHNRAIDGWLEPVFYKGSVIGYIRKFSDRMLELQGKKVDPAYREKGALDINVAGGVLVVNASEIPDKEAWLEEQRKRRAIDSTVVEKK